MASFDNVLLSSSVEITPFECDMSHVAYCHLLQQAYELQHFQMFKRLVIAYRLQYLTQIQSLDANIPTSDVYTGLLKVYQQLEIFNEYLPSKDVAVEQLGTTRNKVNSLTILPDNYCTSNENSCSSSEDSSLDLSIATGLSSKSTLDGNGQINVRTRQCLIDRVSFSDLTVDQFHNKYVKKNLPVVLYDNNTQSKCKFELSIPNNLLR